MILTDDKKFIMSSGSLFAVRLIAKTASEANEFISSFRAGSVGVIDENDIHDIEKTSEKLKIQKLRVY